MKTTTQGLKWFHEGVGVGEGAKTRGIASREGYVESIIMGRGRRRQNRGKRDKR